MSHKQRAIVWFLAVIVMIPGLALAKRQLDSSETLQVSLDITNTGELSGEEVVQLYVAALGSKVERASKELKAFTRVALQPGETKNIRLEIPVSHLATYDENHPKFSELS